MVITLGRSSFWSTSAPTWTETGMTWPGPKSSLLSYPLARSLFLWLPLLTLDSLLRPAGKDQPPTQVIPPGLLCHMSSSIYLYRH